MLTPEQATFIKEVARENDMTYDQLVQYVVDDFLKKLYRNRYTFKSGALTAMLKEYIHSPRFKRKRRNYQNARPGQ